LVADPLPPGGAVVHVMHDDPLPWPRSFPCNHRFAMPMEAGTHRGLSAATQGFVFGDRDTAYVLTYHVHGDGHVLVVSASMGANFRLQHVATINLGESLSHFDEGTLPLPMAARAGELVVGIKNSLWFLRPGEPPRVEETPGDIHQIVMSPPHTRARLFVALSHGGFVRWGGAERSSRVPFASDTTSPRIALSRDGTLIAVGNREMEFYATSGDRLQLRTRWNDLGGLEPLAVVASRQTNRFAVLSGDNRLVIHDVPS
jgi:hypothetical protein